MIVDFYWLLGIMVDIVFLKDEIFFFMIVWLNEKVVGGVLNEG